MHRREWVVDYAAFDPPRALQEVIEALQNQGYEIERVDRLVTEWQIVANRPAEPPGPRRVRT